MANKMLIDASQPEETRVVVLRGNRVEEFDFEAASRKQLRGNIYLAKVTRVEPSLQAAFVEYGGNRHGFLAFAEIHPDYYQIPFADRQALLDEEARAQADDNDEERLAPRHSRRNRHGDGAEQAEKRRSTGDETVSEPAGESDLPEEALVAHLIDEAPRDTTAAAEPEAHRQDDFAGIQDAPGPDQQVGDDEDMDGDDRSGQIEEVGGQGGGEDGSDSEPSSESASEPGAAPRARDNARRGRHRRDRNGRGGKERAASSDDSNEDGEAEAIEQMGGDALEEVPYRSPRMRRQYKIQEVIKRRQVLLVQVVKEERGNKGAALTTYLSLAGRYSVLMPNTARGGGISRKITDSTDRKRLKEIVQDLEVPEGMGIILRTAGASRTKPEVKRDFEYLLRMWETVRELTLKSSAPMLVYEEGSLIKRSIRDLYNKDIDEVIVAGDDGYREARDFMRLLMPSHSKNVKPYTEAQPIFAKAGAEAQLDAMFSNQVTLKSGGYIVINQTEALVAIDVNSGRSTREHNIEDTAVRTNLEAADEVARQLRLRDLAGLIVVDFIDMDENRNNRSVERRMKDALANDRARIQVGRISHFGLLEMSRQRIRTGVLEGSTVMCAHCAGAGMVRATSSIALHVLRVLEDSLIKNAAYNLVVRTRTEVALYILNQKRVHLFQLELRFGVTVTVAADETLTGAIYHAIERGEPAVLPAGGLVRLETVRVDSIPPAEYNDSDEDEEEPVEAEEDVPVVAEEKPRGGGRRDRPGHGQREREAPRARDSHAEPARARDAEAVADRGGEDSEASRKRRRRRRRRGGGADREIVQNFAPGAPQPYDGAPQADGDAELEAVAGQPMVGAQDNFAEGSPAHPLDLAHADQPRLDADFDGIAAPAFSDHEAAGDAKPARRSRRARNAGAVAAAPAVATETEVIKPVSGKPVAAKRPRRPAKAKAIDGGAAEGASGDIASADVTPADLVAAGVPYEAVAAAASASPATLVAIEAVVPVADIVAAPAPKAEPLPEAQAGPKRSGWWQRAKAATFGG